MFVFRNICYQYDDTLLNDISDESFEGIRNSPHVIVV